MKLFGNYRSLSHWFSYNWRWVVIGGLLLLVILYARFLQPREPEPDYLVSWIGVTALAEEESKAVTDALIRLGEDQNGDGEVTVQLRQFIIDFTMTTDSDGFEDNYSYVMRLVGELQTNQCYLFLMDRPDLFQYSTGALQYLDGAAASGGEGSGYESENWERMCVPFQPQGLDRPAYLGRRVLFGDKSAGELFPGSDALFEAVAGLP